MAHGGAQWNGVAIVPSVGICDVDRGFLHEPGFPNPGSALSPRPVRACACGRVYVPDGRSLDDPPFACKLAWLTAPNDALAVEATISRAFGLRGCQHRARR